MLPLSAAGGSGAQQIVLQQASSQPQVIQTPDGQTLLYQPVQVKISIRHGERLRISSGCFCHSTGSDVAPRRPNHTAFKWSRGHPSARRRQLGSAGMPLKRVIDLLPCILQSNSAFRVGTGKHYHDGARNGRHNERHTSKNTSSRRPNRNSRRRTSLCQRQTVPKDTEKKTGVTSHCYPFCLSLLNTPLGSKSTFLKVFRILDMTKMRDVNYRESKENIDSKNSSPSF